MGAIAKIGIAPISDMYGFVILLRLGLSHRKIPSNVPIEVPRINPKKEAELV
jgi:hypothetical protein